MRLLIDSPVQGVWVTNLDGGKQYIRLSTGRWYERNDHFDLMLVSESKRMELETSLDGYYREWVASIMVDVTQRLEHEA